MDIEKFMCIYCIFMYDIIYISLSKFNDSIN